jgi:DNA-binding NarL/FixJ family response regulator
MTAAQARVLELLRGGWSLEQVARTFNVSVYRIELVRDAALASERDVDE